MCYRDKGSSLTKITNVPLFIYEDYIYLGYSEMLNRANMQNIPAPLGNTAMGGNSWRWQDLLGNG